MFSGALLEKASASPTNDVMPTRIERGKELTKAWRAIGGVTPLKRNSPIVRRTFSWIVHNVAHKLGHDFKKSSFTLKTWNSIAEEFGCDGYALISSKSGRSLQKIWRTEFCSSDGMADGPHLFDKSQGSQKECEFCQMSNEEFFFTGDNLGKERQNGFEAEIVALDGDSSLSRPSPNPSILLDPHPRESQGGCGGRQRVNENLEWPVSEESSQETSTHSLSDAPVLENNPPEVDPEVNNESPDVCSPPNSLNDTPDLETNSERAGSEAPSKSSEKGTGGIKVICNICNKAILSKNFKRHKSDHRNGSSPAKLKVCEYCNTTRNKYTYEQHVHGKKGSLGCAISHSFLTYAERLVMPDILDGKVKCPGCMKYLSPGTMKRHKKTCLANQEKFILSHNHDLTEANSSTPPLDNAENSKAHEGKEMKKSTHKRHLEFNESSDISETSKVQLISNTSLTSCSPLVSPEGYLSTTDSEFIPISSSPESTSSQSSEDSPLIATLPECTSSLSSEDSPVIATLMSGFDLTEENNCEVTLGNPIKSSEVKMKEVRVMLPHLKPYVNEESKDNSGEISKPDRKFLSSLDNDIEIERGTELILELNEIQKNQPEVKLRRDVRDLSETKILEVFETWLDRKKGLCWLTDTLMKQGYVKEKSTTAELVRLLTRRIYPFLRYHCYFNNRSFSSTSMRSDF